MTSKSLGSLCDNLSVVGLKNEWEKNSGGGEPSMEARAVSGVTSGESAERTE